MTKLIAVLRTSILTMLPVVVGTLILAIIANLTALSLGIIAVLGYFCTALPLAALLVGVAQVLDDAERQENERLLHLINEGRDGY